MSFFRSISISGSGLTAQRVRMDVISQNIANASTTRTADGTPYRRRVTVFSPQDSAAGFTGYLNREYDMQTQGVKVTAIQADPTPLKRVYDPEHPDADATGYVNLPNVDVTKEMIDMISATRAYEANVTALNASKAMAMKALDIGR